MLIKGTLFLLWSMCAAKQLRNILWCMFHISHVGCGWFALRDAAHATSVTDGGECEAHLIRGMQKSERNIEVEGLVSGLACPGVSKS